MTMINDEEAVFTQNGGARIDSWNTSYATLSGYRTALRLSCLNQDYVFPVSQIVSLRRHRGLFSVGLRIDHSVPLYPGLIVFWVSLALRSSPFALLKERLEALGYEVKE